MLKVFRQSGLAVKILLWTIVLLIGGAMVITLVPGLGGSARFTDPAGNVARVGDYVLTQAEVGRRVAQQMRQFGATDNDAFRQLVTEQVVQTLIDRHALLYEAGELGLVTTLDEVSARLQSDPSLYPGGTFIGQEVYEGIISRQYNMSAPEFERQLQDDLLLQKLRLWVTGGAHPTTADIEQEYRLRNDKVKLEYVVLHPSDFLNRVQATQDDLQAFFEENRESFQLPERRSARYVEINTAILQNRIQIADEEIQRLYRERRAEYLQPEAVRIRHIYFVALTDEEKQEVRKEAEQVLDRIRKGADFARLAEEHSASGGTGGDEGAVRWVELGQADPQLEKKIFSLAPGSPPELVEGSSGFHIVQVLEHRAERTRPLEEVRGELEEFLKQQNVQQQSLADARGIVQAVRDGQTLEEAAEGRDWRVSEFPLLVREQPWPIVGREGVDAAFRLPLTPDGQPTNAVSDPVSISTGYVVVQVKEISPAHPAEFNEVRVQVLNQYRQQKAVVLMRQSAEDLAQSAQSAGLQAAAGRAGFSRETSDWVSRTDTLPGVGLVGEFSAAVFSLPPGGVSPAQALGANWVVFGLLGHQPPDMDKLEEQRSQLERELTQEKRGMVWTMFQSSVRKRLEQDEVVQVNEAALKNLLRR